MLVAYHNIKSRRCYCLVRAGSYPRPAKSSYERMFLSWQVPRDQTCCLKPCLPCECASRKSRPEAFFSHSPIPLNCTIYYTCCRGGGGGYGSYDSKDLGSSLRQISWSEARILGRAAWGSPTPLELETAGQGKCGEEGICGMFFSSCRCLDSDIVEPKHRTNLNKYINRCSLRPVGGLPLLRRLHALFICMSFAWEVSMAPERFCCSLRFVSKGGPTQAL